MVFAPLYGSPPPWPSRPSRGPPAPWAKASSPGLSVGSPPAPSSPSLWLLAPLYGREAALAAPLYGPSPPRPRGRAPVYDSAAGRGRVCDGGGGAAGSGCRGALRPGDGGGRAGGELRLPRAAPEPRGAGPGRGRGPQDPGQRVLQREGLREGGGVLQPRHRAEPRQRHLLWEPEPGLPAHRVLRLRPGRRHARRRARQEVRQGLLPPRRQQHGPGQVQGRPPRLRDGGEGEAQRQGRQAEVPGVQQDRQAEGLRAGHRQRRAEALRRRLPRHREHDHRGRVQRPQAGRRQSDAGVHEGADAVVQGAEETPQKMRLPDPGAGEGGAGQAAHLGRNDAEGDGEGDGVRGHARAVLRPPEHLRAQRAALRGQPLHIQRGLRGPRLLLGRGHPHALRLQAALPRPLPLAAREPRDGQHEPDLRLRGGGEGQVHGADVRPLQRGLRVAAAGPVHQRQSADHARGPLQRGRRHPRRHPQDREEPAAPGLRPHVRPAVVGPAAAERALGQQAGRELPVRARRHQELLGAQPPRLHHPQPRGQGRGLRGGPRRQVRHRLLRAQLLRPDGQYGLLHPPARLRPAPRLPPVHSSASPQRQAHDVRQHPAAAGHDVTPPPAAAPRGAPPPPAPPDPPPSTPPGRF